MRHTVQEVELSNEAKGLFIHIPDASVMSYEINFRAGDYLAPKRKWEAAHLMEHLVLGANKLMPKARTFQAEFEKNGAYYNASTGAYDMIYEAECADFEWDRIADLLNLAISKPLFLPDEFQAEFGNVQEELVGRSNNHFRHLSLALRKAYGFPVLTDQERLKLMPNVKVEDMVRHYKKTHSTSNMRFVIAGKLPADRRKHLLEKMESMEIPKGKGRIDLPLDKPVKLGRPLYISNQTVETLYFYVDTFISRHMKNPELDALNLLNIMMTETLYSKILGTAREKGLIYNMSSGFGQTRNTGNWWIGSQVSPKNIKPLFEIITNEISKVFKNKLPEEDIKASQQYALGRYQRSGQTVGGTAAGYSNRYFFDDVIDDYYKFPERIAAVSKKDIVDITKYFFSTNTWGIGGLGSCGEKLLEELHQEISPLWG